MDLVPQSSTAALLVLLCHPGLLPLRTGQAIKIVSGLLLGGKHLRKKQRVGDG